MTDTSKLIERAEKASYRLRTGTPGKHERGAMGRTFSECADALTAQQKRIDELSGALGGCLNIIDELVQESGRPIEYDEEDPFRMGEWFDERHIATMESARTALQATTTEGEG